MGRHGKISPCLMENMRKYGTTLGSYRENMGQLHTIGTVRPLILKTMGYAVAILVNMMINHGIVAHKSCLKTKPSSRI